MGVIKGIFKVITFPFKALMGIGKGISTIVKSLGKAGKLLLHNPLILIGIIVLIVIILFVMNKKKKASSSDEEIYVKKKKKSPAKSIISKGASLLKWL